MSYKPCCPIYTEARRWYWCRHRTAQVAAALALVALTVAIAWAQTPGAPAQLPPQIDQWTTIVGILLPLGIAVVNRQGWPSGAKAVGAFALCLLAALGDVTFKGQFSLTAWAQTALYVFFLVVTTYVGFWKPTGIAGRVEGATG